MLVIAMTHTELINLSTQDLKDMNIEKVGHRKRIEMAIQQLKQTNPSTSSFNNKSQLAQQQKKRKIEEGFSHQEYKKVRSNIESTPQSGMCMICFEEKDTIYALNKCKSSFCLECLHHYLEDRLKSRTIPIHVMMLVIFIHHFFC